ncbi:MAG: long-chain-fatty-acid--CoA ligase [Gammaproteobacteria bacterium]|nr:long-chain-fatty-acid--CoA ligase [Gammaproteobacteria bacterium]
MDELRPWLRSYPNGVPAEINPDEFNSLKELLEDSFQKNAGLTAFSNSGVAMRFEEVDQLSCHFAAYLQSDTNLQPGDRVAIMLPNLLQYPIVTFGILRAGMVVVNVNPLYTARELEHQLSDSGAKAIIVLENFAAVLQSVLSKVKLEKVIVTAVGDHFPIFKRAMTNLFVRHIKKLVPSWKIEIAESYLKAIIKGKNSFYKDVTICSENAAFLQYTGGTTGTPKGAILTHRNMVSNVLQAAAWAKPFLNGRGDLVITPLPLYHVFSLTANLLCFINLGGHNLLVTNPRDIRSLIRELRRQPFTYLTGVNTLFNALLNYPGFSRINFSKHKATMGGGMAVQASIAKEWQAITGRPLAQGYGLTEASPIVSATPLDMFKFNGSVGLPLPSTEVIICDEAGTAMNLGKVGEIHIRGPQVMSGYWKNPKATTDILSDEGWLKTGDIGRIDEHGFLYIEDRKKDLILVSGFNVYPNEIEDVIVAHPEVIEAAAVGIPDEYSGETVRLFVVRKTPLLKEEQLMEYCRKNLTGYKRPRDIVFMDKLPKNNIGKILRRELRE